MIYFFVLMVVLSALICIYAVASDCSPVFIGFSFFILGFCSGILNCVYTMSEIDKL